MDLTREVQAQEYLPDQVAQHNSPSKRVWVTLEGRVFDITDYLPLHPGGDIILDVAGQDVAPFWETYYHSEDARQLLETMHVGVVASAPSSFASANDGPGNAGV